MKMLSGKKFPQNMLALRMLSEELLTEAYRLEVRLGKAYINYPLEVGHPDCGKIV
jgi:hypothetical protein